MRNFTLFSLLFFFSPFLLHSQFSWQKLNGPSGGGFRVYAGKDGYIFTIEFGNILYRSNNGGQSWEKMPVTPANIWYWPLVVGADGNLYAGKSNSLYRSVNNGQSWTLLNNNIFHESIFALPGGEILIGDYNENIKRSTDNGQTWVTVAAGRTPAAGLPGTPITATYMPGPNTRQAAKMAKSGALRIKDLPGQLPWKPTICGLTNWLFRQTAPFLSAPKT